MDTGIRLDGGSIRMCSKPLNGAGADAVVLAELSVTLKGMVDPATLLTGIGSNVNVVDNRLETEKEARG